jgi:hypothetical protein
MRAKTLKFFPLTFIAGPWGFVVFVPYLLAFMTVRAVAVRVSQRRP